MADKKKKLKEISDASLLDGDIIVAEKPPTLKEISSADLNEGELIQDQPAQTPTQPAPPTRSWENNPQPSIATETPVGISQGIHADTRKPIDYPEAPVDATGKTVPQKTIQSHTVLASDLLESAKNGSHPELNDNLNNVPVNTPESFVYKLTDPHGDPQLTGDYYKKRIAQLEEEKKQAGANLRPGETGSDVNARYDQKIKTLQDAAAHTLKLQNAYQELASNKTLGVDLKDKIDNLNATEEEELKNADPLQKPTIKVKYDLQRRELVQNQKYDAAKIGMQMAVQMGDKDAEKDLAKYNAGLKIADDRKVGYEYAGYDALQTGSQLAEASGNKDAADELASHSSDIQKRIEKSNPKYFRRVWGAQVGDYAYKNEKNPLYGTIFTREKLTPEEIQEYGKKAGLKKYQIDQLTPEDVPTASSLFGQAAQSFVNTVDPFIDPNSKAGKFFTGDMPEAQKMPDNWKGMLGEVASGAGMVGGFMLQSGMVGKALKGTQLLGDVVKGAKTYETAAQMVPLAVANYNSAYNTSKELIGDEPDDAAKRGIYTITMGTIATALMSIDPATKIGQDALGPSATKGLLNTLKKYSAEEIAANPELIKPGIKQTVQKIAEASGVTAAHMGSQAFIMGTNKIADNIAAMITDPNHRHGVMDGVGEAALSASLSMVLPSILAGRATYKANTPLNREIAFDIGHNSDQYIKQIGTDLSEGRITPEDAQAAHEGILQMKSAVQRTPEINDEEQPLTESQRKEYAFNLFQEQGIQNKLKALEDNATANNVEVDKAQTAPLQKKISGLEKQRNDIYKNAGTDTDIKPTVAKPKSEPTPESEAKTEPETATDLRSELMKIPEVAGMVEYAKRAIANPENDFEKSRAESFQEHINDPLSFFEGVLEYNKKWLQEEPESDAAKIGVEKNQRIVDAIKSVHEKFKDQPKSETTLERSVATEAKSEEKTPQPKKDEEKLAEIEEKDIPLTPNEVLTTKSTENGKSNGQEGRQSNPNDEKGSEGTEVRQAADSEGRNEPQKDRELKDAEAPKGKPVVKQPESSAPVSLKEEGKPKPAGRRKFVFKSEEPEAKQAELNLTEPTSKEGAIPVSEKEIKNTAAEIDKAAKENPVKWNDDGTISGGTVEMRDLAQKGDNKPVVVTPSKLPFLPDEIISVHATTPENAERIKEAGYSEEASPDSPIRGTYFSDDPVWDEMVNTQGARFGENKKHKLVSTIANDGLLFFNDGSEFDKYLEKEGIKRSEHGGLPENLNEELKKRGVRGILFRNDYASYSGNELIVIDKGIIKSTKDHSGEAPTPLPKSYSNTKDIAEAYHIAKANDTNPELVKAVEKAIEKPQPKNESYATKISEEQKPEGNKQSSELEHKGAAPQREEGEKPKADNSNSGVGGKEVEPKEVEVSKKAQALADKTIGTYNAAHGKKWKDQIAILNRVERELREFPEKIKKLKEGTEKYNNLVDQNEANKIALEHINQKPPKRSNLNQSKRGENKNAETKEKDWVLRQNAVDVDEFVKQQLLGMDDKHPESKFNLKSITKDIPVREKAAEREFAKQFITKEGGINIDKWANAIADDPKRWPEGVNLSDAQAIKEAVWEHIIGYENKRDLREELLNTFKERERRMEGYDDRSEEEIASAQYLPEPILETDWDGNLIEQKQIVSDAIDLANLKPEEVNLINNFFESITHDGKIDESKIDPIFNTEFQQLYNNPILSKQGQDVLDLAFGSKEVEKIVQSIKEKANEQPQSSEAGTGDQRPAESNEDVSPRGSENKPVEEKQKPEPVEAIKRKQDQLKKLQEEQDDIRLQKEELEAHLESEYAKSRLDAEKIDELERQISELNSEVESRNPAIQLKKKEIEIATKHKEGADILHKKADDIRKKERGNTYSSFIPVTGKTAAAIMDFVADQYERLGNVHIAALRAYTWAKEQFKDAKGIGKLTVDHIRDLISPYVEPLSSEPVIKSAEHLATAKEMLEAIKSGELSIEDARNDIMESEGLQDKTKANLLNYLDWHTTGKDFYTSITLREPENSDNFYEDYPMTGTGERTNYLSEQTLKDVTGQDVLERETAERMAIDNVVTDAINMVGLAKNKYGDDRGQWANGWLWKIKNSDDQDPVKKVASLTGMAWELRAEKMRNPESSPRIDKILYQVEHEWKETLRGASKTLNAARANRLFRNEHYADMFAQQIMNDAQRRMAAKYQETLFSDKAMLEMSKEYDEKGVLRDREEVAKEEAQKAKNQEKEAKQDTEPKKKKATEKIRDVFRKKKPERESKPDDYYAKKLEGVQKEIGNPDDFFAKLKDKIKKNPC